MAKKRKKPKRGPKRKRQRQATPSGIPIEGPGGESWRYVEFELTDEPLDDPYLKNLTPSEREDFDWAGPNLQTEPLRCIEILEPLIDKYPDYPKLYNYLSVAYMQAGRAEEGIELMRETYRRFPKYLFARINYAMQCLREGKLDEIPKIFENKFSLDLLYPERRCRFHTSEFIQFTALMGLYQIHLGHLDIATHHLEIVRKLDPTHPMEKLLTHQLELSRLKQFIGRLS